MIDFLLFYEHKVRELDSLCLLKLELEKKGYTVDIRHVLDLKLLKYSLWKKPKVVVTSAMYDSRVFNRYVVEAVGKMRKVVNFQWEQAFSKEDLEAGYQIPKGTAALVTHLCWGQESHDRLQKAGVKNAPIVGNMQMDTLAPKLRGIYVSRNEIDKKYGFPDKRMILFISSFAFATLSEREISDYVKDGGNYFRELEKISKQSRVLILDWLTKLLRDKEDVFVVYRPHPSESIDNVLLDIAAKEDRFFVNKEDNIKQWILCSDIITTWYSSSVAEIYYAKKKCIILRPVAIRKDIDILMYENGRFITSYEMFLKSIENEEEFPIPEENIISCFGERTDKLSYERISELLENVLKSNKYDIRVSQSNLVHIKGIARRFIEEIVFLLKLNPNSRVIRNNKKIRDRVELFNIDRKKYEDDKVSDMWIENRVETFRKVLGGK